jgi:hypothetical protein
MQITYVSFDQINRDLEILKLEKELSYHKLALDFDKIRKNVRPHYVKREMLQYIKELVSGSYQKLLILSIPYFLKFFKRKRG